MFISTIYMWLQKNNQTSDNNVNTVSISQNSNIQLMLVKMQLSNQPSNH